MPALLKTIAAVPAELNTRLAFYWLLLTAARTGEMRFATWGEIEDGKLWRVPAARMKMQREHLVPLSKQAQAGPQARAAEIRTSADDAALLFPGFTRTARSPKTPCSPCSPAPATSAGRPRTVSALSFSTWAHEVHEADPDVIEACLAHVQEACAASTTGRRTCRKRAALLQAWADQFGQVGHEAAMMDISDPRIGWEWALDFARRGEPAELAKMLVDGVPVPPDMKRDILLILTHPRTKPKSGGRPRGIPREREREVRDLYAVPTEIDPKCSPLDARTQIADALGVSPDTVLNLLQPSHSYKPARENLSTSPARCRASLIIRPMRRSEAQ